MNFKGTETEHHKKILYNQPNLFLDDAGIFMKSLDDELNRVQANPPRFEYDDPRNEVFQDLVSKNLETKEKMMKLMELTRTVLAKIKMQEKQEYVADVEEEYQILKQLDDQYKAVDQMLQKEYAILKKQNQERAEIFTAMKNKERDYDKV